MTMIISFDRLVLGRKEPAILHVEQQNDDTLVVAFHSFTSCGNGDTRAEFRQRGNEFALFLFQYPDSELPEWWQGSELIWSIGEIKIL